MKNRSFKKIATAVPYWQKTNLNAFSTCVMGLETFLNCPSAPKRKRLRDDDVISSLYAQKQ